MLPFIYASFFSQELKTEGSIRVDNIDYNTKLLIMKASRAESGKYKIIAKNSVGEDTAEIDITILGKILFYCYKNKLKLLFHFFKCK